MQRSVAPAASNPPSQTALSGKDRDARPIASWLLKMGFDLTIKALYRREILFPPDFLIPPGTLIASNHQRDVDGPMLGTVLARRHGLRFQWPSPFYATREDLFRPGILSRLTVRWPRPLSALLGLISLAWFFPLGHAEPMRRVWEFTLGDALRALVGAGLGDADAGALLNARGRRETAIGRGERSVRALLARSGAVLEARRGLRRLGPDARAAIEPGFRATVDRQLAHFAKRLDRGRCVYFSPEGTISKNGHFGRVRAGCFRLARMTGSAPWIQPMALGYDTLAPGRSRVVIRVGTAFRADAGARRRDFDANLRGAVLDLVPITPSYLLARFLLHGPRTFTLHDFSSWLVRTRDALARNGATLDPLFERVPADHLAACRLRWLSRRRLVLRDGENFRNICPCDVEPGWGKPANIVRYLDNGLGDAVPDIERLSPC